MLSTMSILLCYDGSSSAKHALSGAHATLGHSPLTLLHVWSPPPEVLADAFSAKALSGGPSKAELERVVFERAQALADEGQEDARQLGLAVQVRVQPNRGALWQTILDIAAETNTELIIIGTRGTARVQPGLLGSVSNAVVHHSQRPVLVVPTAASHTADRNS
jgi:nucleotide-binding universal stress UspA family protein